MSFIIEMMQFFCKEQCYYIERFCSTRSVNEGPITDKVHRHSFLLCSPPAVSVESSQSQGVVTLSPDKRIVVWNIGDF